MRMQLDYQYEDHAFIVSSVGSEDVGALATIQMSHRARSDGSYAAPARYSQAYQLAMLIPSDDRSDSACQMIAQLVAQRDRCLHSSAAVHVKEEGYFKFQSQAGRTMEEAISLMIHDRTGLGKTRSVLNGLQSLCPPHLIVCPKIAKDVWRDEIHEVDESFKVLTIEGDSATRRDLLAPDKLNTHDFVIINYDVLKSHTAYSRWTNQKTVEGKWRWPEQLEMRELNMVDWQSVTFDEAHRIKDPTSIRTRCAWMLANNAKHRYALTATPITQNPLDLWAQCRTIWPDEFQSMNVFRDRFLSWHPNPHGGVIINGWTPTGKAEFEACFGWRMIQRDYKDQIIVNELKDFPDELPARIVHVKLAPEQRKAYNTMVESWFAEDEDGSNFTIADQILEMVIRCRQMANGALVVNGSGEVVGVRAPSTKLNALAEIVGDASCPVVIYTEHEKLHPMIISKMESMDLRVGVLSGKIPDEMRTAWIKDFQEDRLDVLVCTTGAASESVTLTNAGLLIFFQESWSLLQMTQARGRVRRIGSESSVPTIVLRAEDTVEMRVADRLSSKAAFLDEFLGHEDKLRDLLKGVVDE